MRGQLLAVALSCFACSVAPEKEPLVISPDVPAAQAEIVAAAADEWFSAVPCLRRDVLISSDSPNVLMVEPGSEAWVAKAWFNSLILFRDGAVGSHSIALHELGHYLADLEHEDGTVMSNKVAIGELPGHLTDSDIAAAKESCETKMLQW